MTKPAPPGWRLQVHESLASTQDAAIAAGQGGEAGRLAVLAHEQSRGRGRHGRVWEAPSGNLNLSVLLRPLHSASQPGFWALLAGLALHEAVAAACGPLHGTAGSRLSLKWPNDLMLDGAKLGGILIDSAVGAEGLFDWVVIGFGANLARKPELAERPTACMAELGCRIAAPDLACLVLEKLDLWLSRDFADIRAAWQDRASERVDDSGASIAGGVWGGRLRLPQPCLPMLLVIDAGNTNVVFAVHDGARWAGIWRIATEPQRTSDEYAVWLLTLLTHAKLTPDLVSAAVIGTVVPAALYHLRRLCREWFEVEPLVARASLDWGFDILVDNPEDVGADRLLNALAAFHHFRQSIVVIDFGTATTFDVVSDTGAYMGGAIAPGINLSIEALHQAAARLPRIGIGRPQAVIGRGTVSAMQSGIYWGYIGLIEGLVARIRREIGQPARVIATGGLAPLFSEGTEIFDRIDPDLTLDGLRMLAERNPTPRLPRARSPFDNTRTIESE